MSAGWTFDDIPDLSGRTAVVTGANSGLGFVCARELARRGARVVLACRDAGRGAAAVEAVSRAAPDALVELEALDLSSLASVEAFAERFASAHPSLDLLINNAGVMAPPRAVTADGFELQFATNHLGHFALTGRLLGALQAGASARVVTLSSNGHKLGRIDFDDLQSARRYNRWLAYCRSKLANLLFAF
jgi:NAD(P)-dependent dehydrogenase (short-subunit alcohol dehydrogenase family)